ncbi:MAG: type II secretion system protein [Candidatus Hydrogenedentota bacterium]
MGLLKNEKGFTLIELIIVMAVITILLAIIIPTIRGMQKEGWYTKAEKEAETLKVCVEAYYRHNNNYPTNLDDILDTEPRIIQEMIYDPIAVNMAFTDTTFRYVLGTDTDFGYWYIISSRGYDGIAQCTWNATANKVSRAGGDDIIQSNALIQ